MEQAAMFEKELPQPLAARLRPETLEEYVGLADPRALETAVAAFQACHMIGMPGYTVHLTGAVVCLSLAPRSNALHTAYESAQKDALQRLAEPAPLIIRNGVTRLMRKLDYGKGYQYAHHAKDKLTDMQCLPDSLLGQRYYRPTDQSAEAKFKAGTPGADSGLEAGPWCEVTYKKVGGDERLTLGRLLKLLSKSIGGFEKIL